jgi:hypothetical protein
MKKVGGYLLFFGVGSILLHAIGLQFILLSWINKWGDTTASEIRIGFVAVGGVLLWWTRRNEFV